MNNKTKKHWLVLLIACGFAGSSMGINLNIMGVFYQPVSTDLNILVGTFAFHATLASMFISIMGLFINRILLYISFKKMAILGIILSTLATAAMAFVSSPTLFNLLGILRGVGSGLIGVVPFTILLNNWFDEKNGMAISITASFAGIMGVILSPLLTWSITSFGWRQSFLILSVMFVLFNLPLLLIPVRLNPRDEGLLPYGYKEPDWEETDIENYEFNQRKSINYKSLPFISLTFMSLFFTFSNGISQNLPGFALSRGLSIDFGATLLSAAMLANIIFKLSLGSLSGRIGPVKATFIASSVLIVSMVLLLFGTQDWVFVAGSFLYGINYFVPSIGLPLLTREFFGKKLSNRVYPIFALFAGLGAAYSVTFIGYIYDFTQSYDLAKWLVIIFASISMILLMITVSKKSNNKVEVVE